MTRLIGKDGELEGRQFEIGAELYVGREGQELTVDDLEVSRRHAVLRSTTIGVTVEDLKSRNGTFVNGELIGAVTVLSPGDVVRFGTSSFAFETVTTGAYELPEPIAETVRGSSRRSVAASRLLLPEILTYLAITGTAIALILYFALR
jgi:pSer/pThr/pTyr-binding forkhead associated (FHA) protein